MSKVKGKKKSQGRKYITVIFSLLIGMVCGLLIGLYLVSLPDEVNKLGIFLIAFVGMYIFMYFHIIIHEAGHLIFGLITGYRYSSFRIGSFMWVKEKDKICFRKLSIAGTGGQCLMVPPDMADGKIPYKLYNFGGAIVNILAAILFLFFYFLCKDVPYLSLFLLLAAVIGFAMAGMNGIPMRLGTVNNDGYNALSLGKSSEAIRAFWIQMKVIEQTAKGHRLKEMPKEWFVVPPVEEMNNSLTAPVGVLVCNRLVDAHQFEEASRLMEELCQMDTAMVDLHRRLINCDRIYCELIGLNRTDRLKDIMDKEQLKFMKTMKNYPAVLRTEYVYALLAEQDTEKAEKIKEQFDKCAHTYPYSSDIESERELIEIANQILPWK